MADSTKRLSLWALASFVCSLLICPPLCVIGVLLGIVALIETGRRPGVRGRRFAVAGVVIGLLWCAGWGAAAVWWHVNVRTPIIEGPVAPLRAGLDGDIATFRAAFIDGGPDDGAEPFLTAVRARYGTVDSATLRELPDAPRQPPPLGHMEVGYVLRFDSGPVEADAVFVARHPDAGWTLRWSSLAIRAEGGEDLVYPRPGLKTPSGDGR